MMEEKICDIPVYICSLQEYNNYWNNYYERNFRKIDESDEEWIKRRAEFKQIGHRRVTWMYQAIIGYIGVYIHGMDLFTTLSIDVRERKIKGGRPDIYYDPSTFFRVRVSRNMTSKEVMDEFQACMKAMSKERLKNRYIDVEPFYNMCKYIDWHEVFYSEDKSKENYVEEEKTDKMSKFVGLGLSSKAGLKELPILR